MADEDKVIAAIARRLGVSNGQARKAFTLDFFIFPMSSLPIAASGTSNPTFITQADSGFAICKTSADVASDVNVFVANISDTPRYAPFTVTLSDSGSGRDLSSAPVSWALQFGTGTWPVVWPTPKILDPNSTFTARIQNLVATAFNIRMAYIGYKIFGDVAQFRARHS